MINFKDLFTEEEIDEINTGKEMCQAMSVDKKPVICFEILSDIIKGEADIKDLPRETLLIAYDQLKDFTQIWQDIEVLDGRILEKITPKVKNVIKQELDSRN